MVIVSITLGFWNYYNWLKYTILTPSFFSKNRLFVEKSYRDKKIYSVLGQTHKSFVWSQISSNVLNNFILRSRKNLQIVYFLILTVIIFLLVLKTLGGVDIPISNLWQTIVYVFWRFFDFIYFFILQFQYLILVYLVSIAVCLFNLTLSSQFSFFTWMEKNFPEVSFEHQQPYTDTLNTKNTFWLVNENFSILKLFLWNLYKTSDGGSYSKFFTDINKSPSTHNRLMTVKQFYTVQHFLKFNGMVDMSIWLEKQSTNNWKTAEYLWFSNKFFYKDNMQFDNKKFQFFMYPYLKNAKNFFTYSDSSFKSKFSTKVVLKNTLDNHFLRNLKIARWLNNYTTIHNNDLKFLNEMTKLKNHFGERLIFYNTSPVTINDVSFLNTKNTLNFDESNFNFLNNWVSSYNWILHRWLMTTNRNLNETFFTFFSKYDLNAFFNIKRPMNYGFNIERYVRKFIFYQMYADLPYFSEKFRTIQHEQFDVLSNLHFDLATYLRTKSFFTLNTYLNFLLFLQDKHYYRFPNLVFNNFDDFIVIWEEEDGTSEWEFVPYDIEDNQVSFL